MAFKSIIDVLFFSITLMMNDFNLNSKNNSKSLSDDVSGDKKIKKITRKNPAVQNNPVGKKSLPIDDHDGISVMPI